MYLYVAMSPWSCVSLGDTTHVLLGKSVPVSCYMTV